MAQISKEEFYAQQTQKFTPSAEPQRGPFVGFFKIPNDQGEAIVRFDYATPDDLFKDVYTVHPGNAETKWKSINCINDFKSGVTDCPLCKAGVQLQQRFYVKLVEYVRGEDGTITPYARVWNRPTSYIQILTDLFTEYGSLKDCVFKIKRNGEGLQTTYSIMFGNPSIYNEQLYAKDFSAYDGYNMVGGQILDKTKTELEVLAREMTGFSDASIGVSDATPTTPTYTAQTTAPEGAVRRVVYQ